MLRKKTRDLEEIRKAVPARDRLKAGMQTAEKGASLPRYLRKPHKRRRKIPNGKRKGASGGGLSKKKQSRGKRSPVI